MMKRSILTLLLLALLVAAAIAPVVGQALTVSTDKPTYIPGETVVVSGTAPAGSWVGIAVVSPAGKEVDYRMVQADAAGRYTVSIKLPSKLPYADWIAGEYTVYAYLGASRVATTFILSAGSRAFGKVVDARGNPVADAEILVVETGDLARSRADGSFELYTSPGTVTVRVSKPGYTRVEKTVTLALGNNDLGTIAIQPLDEVVAALSSRVAQLEAKVAQLDEILVDIGKTLEVVAALSSRVAQLEAKVAQLDEILVDIGKTLQDISAAIGRLATKDDVTSAKNDILNALKPLSTDLSAVKSDVAAIKTAIEGLNTAVRDVATAVKDVSDAVIAVRGDVTKVRTDVLDAVASAVNAARDAATKADDAKKSADAAKSSADAVVSDINAVKGDVAAIKSSVADTSGTVSGIYTLVIVTLVFAVIGAATSIYILLRLSKALAK
ncbi:MAG: carboxypeptidase regulatory-like domain-containing protein [Ignisphaera sp.]